MLNTEELINSTAQIALLLTIYMFSKIHVMNNLVIVEFTVMAIMLTLFKMTATMEMENYLILYFIIIMICESMVGLSLMISLIRTHSNDYLKSLSITQF